MQASNGVLTAISMAVRPFLPTRQATTTSTLPTFHWIRGPYPPNSNVTGAYPKSMMTCNVVDNSQMLVIGGTYSNDTTYMCDADLVWGTHNMNLGEQDAC
jgi:hypothetical protein